MYITLRAVVVELLTWFGKIERLSLQWHGLSTLFPCRSKGQLVEQYHRKLIGQLKIDSQLSCLHPLLLHRSIL
jgi:hypothetical protein